MREADRLTVRPLIRRSLVVRLHDLACSALGYMAAAATVLSFDGLVAEIERVLPVAVLAAGVSLLASEVFGAFSTRWRLASLRDVVALIQSAVTLTLVMLLLRLAYHVVVPEPFFAAEIRILWLGGVFTLTSQAAGRIACRYLHARRHNRDLADLGQRSEIRFEDFLFRTKRVIDHAVIDQGVCDKTLLITGGGGSIGGDIALRAATHGARKIVLADNSELGLQTRLAQLRKDHPDCLSIACLCDVRDAADLSKLVGRHEPDIMVHAAALKHVDLVEENWRAAVLTNVLGTVNALDAADAHEVPVFINISSDKAVDPVSVLGLTKRAGECLVARAESQIGGLRRFSVRFGNVLGSSGSVVELFLAQIEAGGPVTLTDRRAKRYLMSRFEAAELVLATASLPEVAPLYVLDMGEPIAIRQLAEDLIEWAGFVPGKEIEIREIGLRPGERLEERLTSNAEKLAPSSIEGIRHVVTQGARPVLDVDTLRLAVQSDDLRLGKRVLSFEHVLDHAH